MKLTPLMERYVLHWGEMGTRWGVNRSIAQIHALLFISPRALPADEIAETLAIARSNVSTSLRELQSLGLVTVVHELGDRRDHFRAEIDTWTVLLRIAEARKKREIDPILAMLRDCAIEAEDDRSTDPYVKARIRDVLAFMESMTAWYDQVKRLPPGTLAKIVKAGAKVATLLKR